MALSDLSFKLYTDSALTSQFNGLYQLTHETDLSDNPQDFTLYFGSIVADRQLQANSNPGVDDIVLTPTNTLAEWIAATAYVAGYLVEPTTPNTFKYRCTTAGTSHAMTEPTWPTAAIGDTVADGTVVWTLVGKRHEVNEVTLALTEAELDTNTPGAALNVATTIDSDVANAVEIWIRVENAVITVNSNTGYPEVSVFINSVVETDAV